MGRRGPPPEPTQLKILKGNPGRRRLNQNEPQPEQSKPRCPIWLNIVAKRKWRSVVKQLDAMGVVTQVDGDALANYCQTWARWREMEEFIDKHGAVIPVTDEGGQLTKLQEVPQMARSCTLLLLLNRYQREFGLTPSARASLHVEPKKKDVTGKAKYFEKRSG